MLCGVLCIDLIGSDTEAPNDNELLCLAQYSSCELRFGTDADDVDVSEAYVSSLAPLTARTGVYYTVSAGLTRPLATMFSENPPDNPERPRCLVRSG